MTDIDNFKKNNKQSTNKKSVLQSYINKQQRWENIANPPPLSQEKVDELRQAQYYNSPAATNTLLKNMMDFIQQEKQDRIKSDKKNFWLTVSGIVLMAATLIATIWFGLR